MKTTIKTMAMLALVAFTFSACKKDKTNEPTVEAPTPPGNEEELITTMKVLLHDTTNNTNMVFTFSDVDGPGGNPAIFGGVNQSDSVMTLLANHVYECKLVLLDETKTPADTISNEVEEENADHMFFFNNGNNTVQSTNPYTVYFPSSMLTVKYLDIDANNYGIGLRSLWTAPSMAMPKAPLVIELKHQPGVKNGTYAPGETDIQVSFKVKVN